MMSKTRFLSFGLLTMALALVVAGCGGDDPAPAAKPAVSQQAAAPAATPTPAPTGKIPRTPALEALIAEAKAEGGRLNLLGGSFDEPGSLDEWGAAFSDEFGFELKITFTAGGNMSQVAAQTVEEHKAGRETSTDLYIGTAPSISALTNGDAVEVVDWLALAPWLPEGSVAPDGRSLAKSTQIKGIWYNTNKVTGADIPVSARDLLNPKWKGLVASTPYVARWREAGGYFGELDDMIELLGQLRSTGNLAGLMRCGEVERVASEEFLLFGIACSNGAVREIRTKGAPVDYIVPSDLAIITYVHTAVPKLSAHPALAKLFSIYLLTPEAQKVHWKYYYDDLHLIEGSGSATAIAAKAPAGVELKVVTPDMVAKYTKEFAEANQTLRKAIRGQL